LRLIIKKSIRLTVDELNNSIPDLNYKELQDNKEKSELENIILIDLRKNTLKRPKNENTTVAPGEVVQYENGQHDWGAYPFEGAFVMDGGTQWNGVY